MKLSTAAVLLACLTCVPLLVSCAATGGGSGTAAKTVTADWALQPPDLTPVTWLRTPKHEPVAIVRDGKPTAVVYLADPKARKAVDIERFRGKTRGSPSALSRLLHELDEVIRIQTGATLEFVTNAPSAGQPAIIIGDCEETRQAGIDASKLPLEGFIVKTASNRVYLVGGGGHRGPSTGLPATKLGAGGAGTTWAVADLFERFVGVRWYWRKEYGGRSVPRRKSLVIPPAHYRDQPVFLNRDRFSDNPYLYPLHAEGHNAGDQMVLPLPAAVDRGRDKPSEPLSPKLLMPDMMLMRYGSSVDFTPGLIQGSSAMWIKGGSINKDGSTHKQWACYSSQKTLDAYINRVKAFWDEGSTRSWTHKVITPDSCTLYFPSTPGLVCHCPDCTKTGARFRDDKALRKKLAAEHGDRGAFEILEARANVQVFCTFMKRFCDEVKKRLPDKTVVFRGGGLPAPEGITFPDNFRLDAIWPDKWWALGLEMHPSVGRGYEERMRAWGVPLGIEGSASSPSELAFAPIEYPHLIRDFYSRNRDVLIGSRLVIFCPKIYVGSAPTYYVWSRVMWNPDLDVDAALDEMSRRLFGAGAEPARELLRLQCERWEQTKLSRPLAVEDRHRDQLPGQAFGLGTLAQEWRVPDDLYREIWPVDVVARMKELRDQALSAIDKSKDAEARKAFLYWTWTFEAFLEEAAVVHRKLPADFVREGEKAPLEPVKGLPAELKLDLGDGVVMQLTLIKPGEFMMGSPSNRWAHHRDEGPQRRVRITKPYYMGVHEVTETQYRAITGANPSKRGPKQPVAMVSWNDANGFCAQLAKKTRRTVRLPTEAEWEYACRAGSTSHWCFGGLDKVKKMADYALSHRQKNADVGTKQPNAWGLHDMHGNVAEWCMDRYSADYYARGPTGNPKGPKTGMFRVLRGGSSHNLGCRNPEFVRSANRAYGHPDTFCQYLGHASTGFRVVVDANTVTDGHP